MKQLLLITASVMLISCTNCSSITGDLPPNVRIIPGIEYCDGMCNKFSELQCKPYMDDVSVPCEDQGLVKQYKLQCDAGYGQLTCTKFCEYEMSNSVNLQPKCLIDNLKSCDQIENICK